MKKKILSVILTAGLVLVLAACGENSAPVNESGSSALGVENSGNSSGTDNSGAAENVADKADSSTSSESSGADVSDRHFYKTVAAYGYLSFLYPHANLDGSDGYGEYTSAAVIDYDTSTGAVERVRLYVYFSNQGLDPDSGKESALLCAGQTLSEMDYTIETFTSDSNGEMGALVWDLPEDFYEYAFDPDLSIYLIEKTHKVPQDIDGYIQSVFYDSVSNCGVMPGPVFADNGVRRMIQSHYTLCWYDTEWDITMKDELQHINPSTPDGIDYKAEGYYGSTSYNTGGGYEGEYDYRDYI